MSENDKGKGGKNFEKKRYLLPFKLLTNILVIKVSKVKLLNL